MWVSCDGCNKEPKDLFLEKEDELEGIILNTEVLAAGLYAKALIRQCSLHML